MRIAYLLSEYPAVQHTYLIREIRELRRYGYTVDVIAIRRSDRPLERLTAEEREELRSTTYILPLGILGAATAHAGTMLRRPAPYIRGLALALRYGNWHPMKTAYALVYFTEALIAGRMLERRGHTHFHLHYTSTVGMMLSTVFPITLSMTIHGSAEFIEPAAFYLREKIQASKFVCAISYYGKSQLMLHSPASEWPKFYVTPLGIDIDLYRPAVFREHPQPFEVICVGRLCTGKGYELLIESIAALAAQGRDVKLRLVGDGPERKSLQVLAQELSAEDRIVFEGSRNQNEVRSLYAQADAFALASFAEGVPVVLIEAMAMGLPCVATRITGIPELIRDGVDGLLVTPAIRSELTEALSRLMDNPELRRQMGENARERIRERHEIQKCVRSLAAVFERELPARESVPALNGTAQGTA